MRRRDRITIAVTDAQKTAKRREIAQRYAKRRPQLPLPDRLAAVARAEVWRLFRHRTGGKLSRTAMEQRIADRLGVDWESCGKVELAHRMGLTLQERMHLDIRRFNAVDVTLDQQKLAYRVRRRETHRQRELMRRMKMKRVRTQSGRMNGALLATSKQPTPRAHRYL